MQQHDELRDVYSHRCRRGRFHAWIAQIGAQVMAGQVQLL